MRILPYLNDRERAAVQALLVDRMFVRCRKSESVLDDLLRTGLRLPEAALSPVRASALQDDGELRRLIARFVTDLPDLTLVEELRRTDPDPRSLERLGFDPFQVDRANAYAAAKRPINGRQAIVATVAGALLVLMTLFPPWREQLRETRTHFLILPQKTTTLDQGSAGYAPLFDPPKSRTLEYGKNDRAAYGSRWVVREYRIDLPRLGLQCAATLAAAGVGIYLLRTKPYRAEDFSGEVVPK
jgi:hypothetical protein